MKKRRMLMIIHNVDKLIMLDFFNMDKAIEALKTFKEGEIRAILIDWKSGKVLGSSIGLT